MFYNVTVDQRYKSSLQDFTIAFPLSSFIFCYTAFTDVLYNNTSIDKL